MTTLNFSADKPAPEVFDAVAQFLVDAGFRIAAHDHNRPWGGFFVLDESQAPQFVEQFFPNQSMADFAGFDKLSPKILVVAPQKRLSWQYHFRRAEIWRVIGGQAGVVVSDTDEQTPVRALSIGDEINLKQGERHRLVGVDAWGIVAEIWQHVDAAHPSDEDDIVRLEDDFGR